MGCGRFEGGTRVGLGGCGLGEEGGARPHAGQGGEKLLLNQ
jgi:hypothetical protein